MSATAQAEVAGVKAGAAGVVEQALPFGVAKGFAYGFETQRSKF